MSEVAQLFRRTHSRRGKGDHIEVVEWGLTLCNHEIRETWNGMMGDFWPAEGEKGYKRLPLLQCCKAKGQRVLAELQDVLRD